MTFNEGKACDAVIRVLETREGRIREDLRFPEQERHAAPIEHTCRIGDTLFASEHTGIESFARHVPLQAKADKHFGPIRTMLKELPPTETFELMIPAKATQRVRKRDLPGVQKALAAWVEAMAPTLPIAPYGRYETPQRDVRPPGVPFAVSLYRFPTMGLSNFQITHSVTGRETSRELRLRKAYKDKIPKLDAWRKSNGARTVLIFENNDIQLTNVQDVFETLTRVENVFSDKPDVHRDRKPVVCLGAARRRSRLLRPDCFQSVLHRS